MEILKVCLLENKRTKSMKAEKTKIENMKIKEITGEPAIDLALDTIGMNKQALVFVNTKRGAEKCAEDISKKLKIENEETRKILDVLSNQMLNALDRPTKQCMRLANCVSKGIAFHHSGLHSKQRELVEDSFRDGKIKIISATSTLAMGLDLPAFRAIIRDLKRFGHHGMSDIPVLEYLQMCGRAGRPKYDSYGEAIAVASKQGEKDRIISNYMKGEAEDIFSKLAAEPVLRTYVLSLIASNFVSTEKQLKDFFSKTFWAHQYGDMSRIEHMIDKVIDLLEDYEFIMVQGRSDEKVVNKSASRSSDFVSASDVCVGSSGDSSNDSTNATKLRATLLGKRVAELYLDPLTAFHMVKCLNTGSSREKITAFSLLQMVSATLEMRPLLNVRMSEYDLVQEKLVKENDALLMDEPSAFEYDYDEFMNSVKTAMMFDEWIDEKDEEYLLEKYNVRPGELHYKLSNADWLLYASEEIARLLSHQKLLKDLSKLRFRIKYGVKEELLTLLKIPDVGRVRARKLYLSGIKDIAGVKNADLTTLTQLLGKQIALKVKKAVGEDFEKMPVSDGKRKGQLGLGKYE
ncbi:MAG: helicase-related protein [Nanoarchaeota archaeon]|nr:helicase-related protein [Nanoarchaeota archaeon]